MNEEIISTLLMIVGGVTILTNIIVQVVKSITWDKIPTNLVALFVAEALTLAAGGAYASINGLAVTWYMVVAAIVVTLRCLDLISLRMSSRSGRKNLNDRRSRQ